MQVRHCVMCCCDVAACRYASRDSKFVWDPTTEESFRVSTIKSTSGAFDVDAPCYAKNEYGMLLLGDGKSSSAKRGVTSDAKHGARK